MARLPLGVVPRAVEMRQVSPRRHNRGGAEKSWHAHVASYEPYELALTALAHRVTGEPM